jgi:hypothetical protein
VTAPHHAGRFAPRVDNRLLEALLRTAPVPLAPETLREARLAARRGLDIRPVLALASVSALRAGRRSVTLADFDAGVVAQLAPVLSEGFSGH